MYNLETGDLFAGFLKRARELSEPITLRGTMNVIWHCVWRCVNSRAAYLFHCQKRCSTFNIILVLVNFMKMRTAVSFFEQQICQEHILICRVFALNKPNADKYICKLIGESDIGPFPPTKIVQNCQLFER